MKRLADLLRDPQFRTDVGDNARDFLQSASNTAASNVTAPIDGLAYLLRKFNVPVPQAPVGGSDWAQNAGLMAEPKNKTSLASLLGEAAGNIAPIVGYAKAPEIAGGINQMIRNANAPTPFNNAKKGQLGAVVWHGSPHKFDAFDASKIGTGEGAQAYGHGLYVAENPKTASSYKTFDPREWWIGQQKVDPKALKGADKQAWDVATLARTANREPMEFAAQLMNEGKMSLSQYGRVSKFAQAELRDPTGGNLYKVDLPDEQIAKFLDWDKPLSQQAPEVQSAMAKFHGVGVDDFKKMMQLSPDKFDKSGQQFINDIAGRLNVRNPSPMSGGQQASNYLKDAGIPGIRYLDGGSRGAGQGSSNFVVFPGNESLLKILSRNGQNLP